MKRRGFLMALGGGGAFAGCSCPETNVSLNLRFPLFSDKLLFRGRVTSSRTLPVFHWPIDQRRLGYRHYSATFSVAEYWRAAVPRSITIHFFLAADLDDCMLGAPDHRVGEDYLVYAQVGKVGSFGILGQYNSIDACVPVGAVRHIPEVIKALGSGRKPGV